jgi:5-methylcytosine-specific restriction enzyme subunit McrC
VPTKAELDRIRYTPITAGFSRIAELSRQIANRRGLSVDIDASGETKGVLLDVAELWEMYVINVLRKAAEPLNVMHGTREKAATEKMLYSDVTGRGLGTLIPDALIHSGAQIVSVADAKYKSLHPTASAPNGPQREDLYQMGAYIGRFRQTGGEGTFGLLLYPYDPERPTTPVAETSNPWTLDRYSKIAFVTLPHDTSEAVTKLRSYLRLIKPELNNWNKNNHAPKWFAL